MSDHAAVAHQFDSPEQQTLAGRIGMWTFLITEILFFGGMFAGYTEYRVLHPRAFELGSARLDLWLGAVNTAVLILSSLSMAFAVHAAAHGRRRALIVYLVVTMLLGAAFLGIKANEYLHKLHEGLIPGRLFAPHAGFGAESGVELFFSFYFAMTGMHALHMVIGIGVLIALVVLARRNRFTPESHGAVEATGLYWHFVDIIWIFLYPLLYLVGARA